MASKQSGKGTGWCFNMPTKWCSDPIFTGLGVDGWWLLTHAGAWCIAHDSDGVVSATAARFITPTGRAFSKAALTKLVDAKIAELMPDGGFRMPGWSDPITNRDRGEGFVALGQTTVAQRSRQRETWRLNAKKGKADDGWNDEDLEASDDVNPQVSGLQVIAFQGGIQGGVRTGLQGGLQGTPPNDHHPDMNVDITTSRAGGVQPWPATAVPGGAEPAVPPAAPAGTVPQPHSAPEWTAEDDELAGWSQEVAR